MRRSRLESGFGSWLRAIAIAGLSIGLCHGCAKTPSELNRYDAAPTVNVADLIMIITDIHDKTGKDDKAVTLFYDRQTGCPVGGIDLFMQPEFSEGLTVARRDPEGQFGYVDIAGRVVIPFRYYMAWPFHEGRAVVWLKEVRTGQRSYGLIDRAGQWIVVPGQYEEIGPYREGRCAFRVGKLWGFLDGIGRVVVPPRFVGSEPPVFSSAMAAAREQGGRVTYVDKYGRVVVMAPEHTQDAYPFCDGLARIAVHVHQDNPVLDEASEHQDIFGDLRFGYIAATGNVVVPPAYTAAGDFSEGLAPVSQTATSMMQDDSSIMMVYELEFGHGKSWGYIDAAGKMAIPFTFERAGRFSCGVARVRENGKWGYIDKTGRYVIQPCYGWAWDFRNGVAEVWHEGNICFIDRAGKVVVNTGLPAVAF